MAKANKSSKSQPKPAVTLVASPAAPRWVDMKNGGAESVAWQHTVIWRDTHVNVVGWFLYPMFFIGAGLYGLVIYLKANDLLFFPNMITIVPLLILFAFLALITAGMAAMLNTSILCQRSGWLQVHTAPLALPRTRSRQVSQVRALEIGEWKLWKWRSYYLVAQLDGGQRFKLLSGFYSRETLEKIASELRHDLHL